MRLEDYENSFEERPIQTGMSAGIKIGLALMVVFFALGGVGFIVHLATNPVAQAGRIVDKTIDADNVIYNYEWFHREYGDFQAFGPKLQNAKTELVSFEQSAGPRQDWTFDDKQEHARLESIVLGLQNQRADIVQEYNARAEMSNRSWLIGKSLPSHIE